MRVAVYTVALNEEKFLIPWYESSKEADYLLIVDTGSSDNLVSHARDLGINVVSIKVNPWRFDLARNTSLSLIPEDIDYCIALDMDEILLPGWRTELEKVFNTGVTRPRYQYTWNWNPDGSPGLQYGGDKIHSRFGYRWKHPVHEVLTTYGGCVETQAWTELKIHHFADNTKPRSQYLPLLKIAVEEDQLDDRNSFYYARELYFNNRYDEAKAEFLRHLSLPNAVWPPERAASMRYLAKMEQGDNSIFWFNRAIEECPGRREPWVDLAKVFFAKKDWEKCLESSLKATEIAEKPLEYLCEAEAWGSLPWDLAALSFWNLGVYDKALEYGNKALEIEPKNERLIKNMYWFKLSLKK